MQQQQHNRENHQDWQKNVKCHTHPACWLVRKLSGTFYKCGLKVSLTFLLLACEDIEHDKEMISTVFHEIVTTLLKNKYFLVLKILLGDDRGIILYVETSIKLY